MRDQSSPIHDVLAANLEYISTCKIQGKLYNLGRYPGLKPGDDVISGELYRIGNASALATIDEYEATDNDDLTLPGFSRKKIELMEPKVEAWVYIYDGDVLEENRIADGVWM